MLASPIARRLAAEKGIDLSKIKGTGTGGRIMQEDVLSAVASVSPQPAGTIPAPVPAAAGDERIVHLSMPDVKRRMAERMAQSKREIPHFFESIDVDCSGLRARKEADGQRLAGQGIRLTHTALLVEGVAKALAEFPLLTSRWEKNAIVEDRHIHIGVATAVDDGLIVPVVHDVNLRSLAGIAGELERLSAAAHAKRFALSDLEGGTFTISNVGMFQVHSVWPIINPPQCAILGVGAIEERLIVREGAIRILPVMTLVLGADHRIVDGVYTARFLASLQRVLEARP